MRRGYTTERCGGPIFLRGAVEVYNVEADDLSCGLIARRADGSWARCNGWGRLGTARYGSRRKAALACIAWDLLQHRKWERQHGQQNPFAATISR